MDMHMIWNVCFAAGRLYAFSIYIRGIRHGDL